MLNLMALDARLYCKLTHIKGVGSCLGNTLDQFVGGVWAPLDVRASSQYVLQDTEGQCLTGAGCCWLTHHCRVNQTACAAQTNLPWRIQDGNALSNSQSNMEPTCRAFTDPPGSPPRYWALAPVAPDPLRMFRNCSPTCFSTVWSTPELEKIKIKNLNAIANGCTINSILVYVWKSKTTKNICLLTKSNKSHSCTCKIVLDKLMQLENNVFEGILC